MNYLCYLAAGGQSLYRAYDAYAAATWQPSPVLREAPRLSAEAHDIAKQSGLKKDIQIVVADLRGVPARAIGNNSYQTSAIYILIEKDWLVTNNTSARNDAMNVVVRHEYSHLLHDDFFNKRLISTAASLAAIAMGSFSLSPFNVLALVTGAGVAAGALYSRYAEQRADVEAFQRSSVIELEQFKNLLEMAKSNNLRLREGSFLGQLCFSSEGDDRRQLLTYPSLSNRIQAVSEVIVSRSLHQE